MVSTSSLKYCKKLKIYLFKCSEHLFSISRLIQNHFLKRFLWTTLNLDGLEGSVLLSQKTVSNSSLKNLQKTKTFPFQTLKTFVFELKVASKPFSKRLPITKSCFKKFALLYLTFPENGFNFVNQIFAKH